MKAHVDDELVIESPHVDQPTRLGRIVEVRGPGGEPPYLVEWEDSGHRVLMFPGPDAHIRFTHEGAEQGD